MSLVNLNELSKKKYTLQHFALFLAPCRLRVVDTVMIVIGLNKYPKNFISIMKSKKRKTASVLAGYDEVNINAKW
jgi:hypothetical protein